MHTTPVPSDVADFVLARDGGCVAPYLGAPDACRNVGGYPVPPGATHGWVELDHVRGEPPTGGLAKTREGGKGKAPPSDAEHLVSLCHHHHQDGWATAHRPRLRRYLVLVRFFEMLRAAQMVMLEVRAGECP